MRKLHIETGITFMPDGKSGDGVKMWAVNCNGECPSTLQTPGYSAIIEQDKATGRVLGGLSVRSSRSYFVDDLGRKYGGSTNPPTNLRLRL